MKQTQDLWRGLQILFAIRSEIVYPNLGKVARLKWDVQKANVCSPFADML